MKQKLAILLTVLFPLLTLGQAPNSWINYTQKYYAIPITETGIYRIDSTTLSAILTQTGDHLPSIDPRNFQIFGKEKEIPIYIPGESDGVFNGSDYIEFYAEKNDTWLDTTLFVDPSDILNNYYSFENDTLRYYLTFNSSTNNHRMQLETDVSFGTYPASSYCWYSSVIEYHDEYLIGNQYKGLSNPTLESGEGWSSLRINPGNPLSATLNCTNKYTGIGAPEALLRARSAGASDANYGGASGNHNLEVTYTTASGSSVLILDTTFIGFDVIHLAQNITPINLGNTTTITYTVPHVGLASDYQSVGQIELNYPHTYDLGGVNDFWFEVENEASNKLEMNFSNFSGATPLLYVFDGDSLRRVALVGGAGSYSAITPATNNGLKQKAWMVDESLVQTIPEATPVFSNGFFREIASPVDSAYLIITHESLLPEARQYAGHRSSVDGGNYDTLVINVEQIYHQFGGGVFKSGVSLRRFMNHTLATWSVAPSNLFLIGKSVFAASEGRFQNANDATHGTRKGINAYRQCLVPSLGHPSSDDLISKQPGDADWAAGVPTGRLSVRNATEVLNYLEKVQLYDANQNQSDVYTIPNKEWQKKIIHFGGGASAFEQSLLKSYLNNYKNIAQDTLFGGSVDSYFKQSSDPISPVVFEEVSDQLREGVSLITFFGHSTSAGFDQNIDSPENWDNYGKYPIVLGLGCYAGDVHQPTSNYSASEGFVLTEDFGAVATIATVKVGFSNGLNAFGLQFYNGFSHHNYGGTVGESIQYSKRFVSPNSPMTLSGTVGNVSLQGDPALKMNYHQKPELVLDPSRVFFEPEQVTLSVDSFDLNVVVTNLGVVTTDTLTLEVIRTFPDGSDSLYQQVLYGSYYRDTVAVRMPTLPNIAEGLNRFEIKVDLPSKVSELYDDVNNNILEVDFYIRLDGIVPVWPYKYAIVGQESDTLKASTLDPFLGTSTYLFEIDTTHDFNSSFKKYQQKTGSGGVVELYPADWLLSTDNSASPLVFTDSTVYFWRAAKDSSTLTWNESSFQFIRDRYGWGQAHFHQFEPNEHNNLKYNRPARIWETEASEFRLRVSTVSYASTTPDFIGTNYSINNDVQDYAALNFNPAIHIAVIDPDNLEAWGTPKLVDGSGSLCNCIPLTCANGVQDTINPTHFFGQANEFGNCGRSRPDYYFSFNQNDPNDLMEMENMLVNEIPDGHYVIAYTWLNTVYANWDANSPGLYTAFQNLGATNITTGKADELFIFFCKKGDPASAQEVFSTQYGTGMSETVVLEDSLELKSPGRMTSVTFGPVSRWDALYWEQASLESVNTDSSRIRLFGVQLNGTKQLVLDTIFTSNDSIINLQNILDASIYPYAVLEGDYADLIQLTPAQTKRWQLLGQQVPEAAINPKKGFYLSASQMAHGDSLELAIAIENISPWKMDSLLVHYYVEDQNNVRHYLPYDRQDSLRAGEILFDTVRLSSEDFAGQNRFWIAANPILPSGFQDQPEQHYFNNVAYIDFEAKVDRTNPILDVTFDGHHILNGDIVSPKPFVKVSLDDENQFFVFDSQDDTSNVSLFIQYPNTSNYEPLRYRNGQNEELMRFVEATLPENKCSIEFEANFTKDGTYKLLVQAKDKSNNASGDVDYEIEFEVINRSTITNVLNYPNPFSTRTQFVFTLTGSEIPDAFTIQILSATGRVVREITRDEIGPIRIGNNRTAYYWDGRDQFGDQLANGVYFYRVLAKINNQSIEHRETSADSFFNKGFGKMYLMR